MLAAYHRLKRPDFFASAVASSAPMQYISECSHWHSTQLHTQPHTVPCRLGLPSVQELSGPEATTSHLYNVAALNVGLFRTSTPTPKTPVSTQTSV